MTDSPRVFVDTNVLIYAYDRDAGKKNAIAASWLRDLWHGKSGVLSTQVLQEFYVNVTRKIAKPLKAREAREIVEIYAHWEVASIDARDVMRASAIEERWKLSFWDALIIAAAKKIGAVKILSEDLNARQKIDGITIENPFAA